MFRFVQDRLAALIVRGVYRHLLEQGVNGVEASRIALGAVRPVDARLLSDAALVAECRRRGSLEVLPRGSYARLARDLERAELEAGRASRAIMSSIWEEVSHE
jgi:hypothetical protein